MGINHFQQHRMWTDVVALALLLRMGYRSIEMLKHVAMFICLMNRKFSLDKYEKSNSIVTLASFYQETI
jgi:hypothetical protein